MSCRDLTTLHGTTILAVVREKAAGWRTPLHVEIHDSNFNKMMSQNWLEIEGTKPLPEPMLTKFHESMASLDGAIINDSLWSRIHNASRFVVWWYLSWYIFSNNDTIWYIVHYQQIEHKISTQTTVYFTSGLDIKLLVYTPIGQVVLKIDVPCKNFHMPSQYLYKPCKSLCILLGK